MISKETTLAHILLESFIFPIIRPSFWTNDSYGEEDSDEAFDLISEVSRFSDLCELLWDHIKSKWADYISNKSKWSIPQSGSYKNRSLRANVEMHGHLFEESFVVKFLECRVFCQDYRYFFCQPEVLFFLHIFLLIFHQLTINFHCYFSAESSQAQEDAFIFLQVSSSKFYVHQICSYLSCVVCLIK